MAVSPISSNFGTSAALNALSKTRLRLALLISQLSTGNRIVNAAVDPAGLVLQEQLRAQLSGTESAQRSLDMGQAMLNMADASLSSVGDQLIELRGLTVEALGTNDPSALRALQDRADQLTGSIERELSAARFGGRPIFGDLAYSIGADSASRLTDVEITATPSPVPPGGLDVSVDIQAEATAASASLTLSGAGILSFDLQGPEGTETFNLTLTGDPDADSAALTAAINSSSEYTGITATDVGGGSGQVDIATDKLGGNALLLVSDVSGGLAVSNHQSTGTDAQVLVNGAPASADGNDVIFSANGISGSFTVAPGPATQTSFEIQGGGFTVVTDDSGNTLTVGIPQLSAASLGLSALRTGGSASLENNPSAAYDAVSEAMDRVLSLRSRLGSTSSLLSRHASFLEGRSLSLSDTLSTISDVDFAATIVEINRLKIQHAATTAVIGSMHELYRNSTLKLLSSS